MRGYPTYKDSEVEWIGRIPVSWDIRPLFTVASESKISNKGMIESNLLSLSYGRIIQKDIETLGGLLPESFETYQVVNENDIIFRLTDLQNDKRSLRSAICRERGIITSAYVAVTPKKIRPKFMHYLMRSYDETKVFYNLGSGMRQSLKYDELKRLPLVTPPESDQKQVEDFLDRETTRIDNLIAEKQTFINLLKEKRQALISHMVTKGLNPKVKMKDSGVEWIGEVPEHWSVQPLKLMAELIDGDRGSNYPSDSDIKDNGVPFVSSKNIVNYRLTKNKLQYITLEKYESLGRGKLTQGDLVITVRGTIGHVALFDSDVIGHETGFINAQMMIIRPTLISAKFLQFYSESISWKTQLDISSYGTAVKQLSNKVLQMVHVAVPSNSEIEEIVSRIETETGVIEEIANETQRSIDLLKEHRAALISAAVTGKIDVRNYKEKAV